MSALRLVIDTNVLISAALSPRGAPAQLVQAVLAEHCMVFSQATFAELETRLWKPKFDRYVSLEARKALLRDFSAAAVWANIPQGLAVTTFSRDPQDDMFIHTALAANADCLVSGDQDLLILADALQASHQMRIYTVTQALGVVKIEV
jgi:uncharacterized protein